MLALACAPSNTAVDVAHAMCAKNIACGNLRDDTLDACTTRVAATMPYASCTSAELDACEEAIINEACTSPEARLPVECGVCE